jgi:hypothetical protein
LDKVLLKVAGLERMRLLDKFFLFDRPKNRANIVGSIFFEKFDFKTVSDILRDKTMKMGVHKMRSKINWVLGNPYFKSLSDQEFLKVWP